MTTTKPLIDQINETLRQPLVQPEIKLDSFDNYETLIKEGFIPFGLTEENIAMILRERDLYHGNQESTTKEEAGRDAR